MKKKLLFLIISFSLQQLTAQDTQFKKNTIYGSIGFAGLYGSATGYYERIIKQNMWSKNISSFVKVGYGGVAYWGGESTYLLAHYGVLTGIKTHHLEVSLGPIHYINNDLGIPVSANLAWRIQKPRKNFIFRIGLGLPESIYTGVGIAF